MAARALRIGSIPIGLDEDLARFLEAVKSSVEALESAPAATVAESAEELLPAVAPTGSDTGVVFTLAADYDYEFTMHGLMPAATAQPIFLLSKDGGATWLYTGTAIYSYTMIYRNSAGTLTSAGTTVSVGVTTIASQVNSGTLRYSAVVKVLGAGDVGLITRIPSSWRIYSGSGSVQIGTTWATHLTAEAHNAIRFEWAGGGAYAAAGLVSARRWRRQ